MYQDSQVVECTSPRCPNTVCLQRFKFKLRMSPLSKSKSKNPKRTKKNLQQKSDKPPVPTPLKQGSMLIFLDTDSFVLAWGYVFDGDYFCKSPIALNANVTLHTIIQKHVHRLVCTYCLHVLEPAMFGLEAECLLPLPYVPPMHSLPCFHFLHFSPHHSIHYGLFVYFLLSAYLSTLYQSSPPLSSHMPFSITAPDPRSFSPSPFPSSIAFHTELRVRPMGYWSKDRIMNWADAEWANRTERTGHWCAICLNKSNKQISYIAPSLIYLIPRQ